MKFNYLKKISSASSNLFLKNFFGFIHGHHYLKRQEFKRIKTLVYQNDETVIDEFEDKFARLIGDGQCISYAAGRMGFYELLKYLNIKQNDEVIMPASTCSVMVNAILRVGAKPIFTDIDEDTFGSCLDSIKRNITKSTRLIVAQHSFGIPCQVDKISKFAKKKKIFLLEDCALTLGSTIDGKKVGNFGDAALFSLDHTKPINTITGGILYTKNNSLAEELKTRNLKLPNLPIKKKVKIFKRIKFEKYICNASNYKYYEMLNIFESITRKITGMSTPFLSGDFGSQVQDVDYLYPSRLPSFLAYLGLLEVRSWNNTEISRVDFMRSLMDILGNHNINLPKCYYDKSLKIIPLRLAWYEKNGFDTRNNFKNLIDINYIWFMKPIVATEESLENFGYSYGSCTKAETIGKGMLNLPCNLKMKDQKIFLRELIKVLSSN